MRKFSIQDLQDRILILDGAMGTLIQSMHLNEDDFRGFQFKNHSVPLKGNYDLLNITNPSVIQQIHRSYIEAGADLITTNTFNSNAYSQKEYGLENYVKALNFQGALLAREVADSFTDRKIWVAGSMGPTSKVLSLTQELSHPQIGDADFKTLATTYKLQADSLIRGGADLILLETCFDALNTKAALYAIERLSEEMNITIPVMVSATIDDKNGRTLTGQTLKDFYDSIANYPIFSFGINCSFGVTTLEPFIEQIAETLPCAISVHPNAGLPNEKGEYEQTPAYMAEFIKKIAERGYLNIAGGCCGTTPAHIQAIATALKGIRPHECKAR